MVGRVLPEQLKNWMRRADGYLGDDDVLVASIQEGLVGSALLALLKGGGARRGARGEFCGGMWRRTYGCTGPDCVEPGRRVF